MLEFRFTCLPLQPFFMIFCVCIFRPILNIHRITNCRLICFSLKKPSELSSCLFARNYFHDHQASDMQNIALTVSVFHNIVTPCSSTRILRRVVWWYQFVDKLHPDPWLWHCGTKTLHCQDTAHYPLYFWPVLSLLTHVAAKIFEDRSTSDFPHPFPLSLLHHLSFPVPSSQTGCLRQEKH
jgi:hypothetical protein